MAANDIRLGIAHRIAKVLICLQDVSIQIKPNDRLHAIKRVHQPLLICCSAVRGLCTSLEHSRHPSCFSATLPHQD